MAILFEKHNIQKPERKTHSDNRDIDGNRIFQWTLRNVYGVGSLTVGSTSSPVACTPMRRHVYNWNIVGCDVKNLIYSTYSTLINDWAES